MAEDSGVCLYYGTWKIVEFLSLAGSPLEAAGIEGTEFCLDDSGDVVWKVADGVEHMPFFNSETFEVSQGCQPSLKLFGSDADSGHVIEFKAELSGDFLLLTYDNWFMLQCQRVSQKEPKGDQEFSFLNALEDGYFSDVTIVAESGKEYKTHKTILSLTAPHLDWSQVPTPLSGLPESVLDIMLYYLYSTCLPPNLTEESAKHCLQVVKKMPGFNHLTELCEMFLKSMALKQQIVTLVNDMHDCANRIIDYFSGKSIESVSNSPSRGTLPGTCNATAGSTNDSLASNPAKLCFVVKQSLQECAIAAAKLLILCDLFTKRKNELSKVERHEIIKYTKSRLPVFMHQLHRFLEVARQTFIDVSPAQRQEIALYLVPQIESTFETMAKFAYESKLALNQIVNTSNSTSTTTHYERSGKKPVKEVLGKSLRHILHVRDLKKLGNFNDKVNSSCMNWLQKKAIFSSQSSENKVRSVVKNLDQVIEEIPIFLARLEELMSALDNKLTWCYWKYTFKLGTAKVAWVLQRLVNHKSILHSVVTEMCDMVHRDQFTHSMTTLGLLDPPNDRDIPPSGSPVSKTGPTMHSGRKTINPIESFSIPPAASASGLAKTAVQMLKSGHVADMVFEIICVEDASDTVIDHTLGEPVGHSTQEQDVEVHQIRAHRIIIASRCDWFRRALLSGMREAIDKKIVVHETNPALFKVFLEYLYGGVLDSSSLTTDQLTDLMLLSDRYEVDSLKQLCEMGLKSAIGQDTALFLLSVADQFNAKTLKKAALEYVTEHPRIVENDVFCELPEDLQAEVEYSLESRSRSEASGGGNRKSQKSSADVRYHRVHYCRGFEVEDMVSSMHLTNRDLDSCDPNSLEDVPLTEDSAQLEACVAQLRDIVGDAVPHDELVSISLAADYDVNRALNYIFTLME